MHVINMTNCIRCNCVLISGENWYKSFEPKRYYVCIECAVKEKAIYRKEKPYMRLRYDNSIKGKYRYYKKAAKHCNRTFELTRNDFAGIISQPCYYCGELQENFNGIDRRDNKKDYILNNCVPCCAICNMMKRNATESQFILKCKQIMEKQNLKLE